MATGHLSVVNVQSNVTIYARVILLHIGSSLAVGLNAQRSPKDDSPTLGAFQEKKHSNVGAVAVKIVSYSPWQFSSEDAFSVRKPCRDFV